MSAVARALGMFFVVIQSLFKWDEDKPDTSTDSVHHLTGLILARGGSKGIPKKNLVEINGRPLIGIALDAMIQSGVFTSIWLSTDDDEIADWVRTHYDKQTATVHRRAPYTATDFATSITAVLEFLNAHPEVDAIGLVQATSPFVKPHYLKEAAAKLLQENYDSVFSATRSHQLRWSLTGAHGKSRWTRPLNFNPKSRPRRQEWQGEMVENGMFYFAFRHVLVNFRVFQAERSGYVEIPKHASLEIDTVEDLEMARCLAKKIFQQNGAASHGYKGVHNAEL